MTAMSGTKVVKLAAIALFSATTLIAGEEAAAARSAH